MNVQKGIFKEALVNHVGTTLGNDAKQDYKEKHQGDDMLLS